MKISTATPLSDHVEAMSQSVEDFDGLPLGYMPIIIVVVIALICIVGWFIAKRELGDD
jgi:hypothetical protein